MPTKLFAIISILSVTFAALPFSVHAATVTTKTVTSTKSIVSTKTLTRTSTVTVSLCTPSNNVPTAPPSNTVTSSDSVPTAPPTNSSPQTVTPTIATTSTTSSSPATTYPSSSKSSGKIALAWANKERDSIANFVNKNVTMVYTWSPYCPSQAASLNLLCCPMLWGPTKLSQFQQVVVPGYSTCVMGFNEPMVSAQSNITPNQAADLWMSAIHPLTTKGYTTVIGPSILSSTSGINWMNSFKLACPQCYDDIDIIAVHTYNINATKSIATYNQIHSLYPTKKIAITEFACQSFYSGDPYHNCSVDQAQAFMSQIMKFVETTPWMVWAAYFGMFKVNEIGDGVYKSNAMIGDDNFPNELGRAYLTS